MTENRWPQGGKSAHNGPRSLKTVYWGGRNPEIGAGSQEKEKKLAALDTGGVRSLL